MNTLFVGSTTVKIAVVDAVSKKILWSKCQRHETRQAECVLAMLGEILTTFPNMAAANMRVFITGSGASPIAPHIGARFVREVNAVTFAVEELHPDVGCVIELGGQDSKIIIFKEITQTGEKRPALLSRRRCHL